MTAKIKLNAASGGGSISIQAPSSSSNNRVISLPDIADGTLVTSESTLDATKLSGNLPALNGSALTNISGGKLLKYYYWEMTNEFSTNSTSYVDVTNASYDFTPSAAGSKIWLLFTPMVAAEDHVQTADGFMAIRSGSTTLFETKHWNYTFGGHTYRTSYTFNHPIQYIDTPTYTLGNSINYKLSIKKDNSEMRVNYNGQGKSNFLIWEIAA